MDVFLWGAYPCVGGVVVIVFGVVGIIRKVIDGRI